MWPQIDQSIIYLIFKKLLNYFQVVKWLKYKKNYYYICKSKTTHITPLGCNYRVLYNLNNIILVVALNFLHNNFKIIIAFLLYSTNKNSKKIQQIVTFMQTNNLAKRTTC